MVDTVLLVVTGVFVVVANIGVVADIGAVWKQKKDNYSLNCSELIRQCETNTLVTISRSEFRLSKM